MNSQPNKSFDRNSTQDFAGKLTPFELNESLNQLNGGRQSDLHSKPTDADTMQAPSAFHANFSPHHRLPLDCNTAMSEENFGAMRKMQ